MLSVLFLGFLIGMQHALEADHVAAVSSLAVREPSFRKIVRYGTFWGIGHAATLLVFAGGGILLNAMIGDDLAYRLEQGVGIMLVLLGGHLLWRLMRDRVHFHSHRHSDGRTHFHAHSHAGEHGEHRTSAHEHNHPQGLPIRLFVVGMIHGMAGSAALLVLSASAIDSPTLGLAYIVLFGVGSIIGMALLSSLLAVPLAYTARFLNWGNKALQGLVGAGTAVLGFYMIV